MPLGLCVAVSAEILRFRTDLLHKALMEWFSILKLNHWCITTRRRISPAPGSHPYNVGLKYYYIYSFPYISNLIALNLKSYS